MSLTQREAFARTMEHLCKHDGNGGHGYSQIARWGDGTYENVDLGNDVFVKLANGDRDCSSGIISALKAVGIDTGNASYTGNMRQEIISHNPTLFAWSQRNARRGDIYLNERHHTAMCTSADPDMLCQFSISENGTVRGKQGDQNGRESNFRSFYNYPWDGKIVWLNDGATIGGSTSAGTQAKTIDDKLDEDGYGGPLTIAKWQSVFGTTVDGVISGQVSENKDYIGNIWSVQYDSGSGSILVQHIQNFVGASADGIIGKETASKIQQNLVDHGYSVGASGIDGYLGHDSIVALQKSLNDGGDAWRKKTSNPSQTPAPTNTHTLKIDEDGMWGEATNRELQTQLGTVADGVISSQYSGNKQFYPGVTSGWEWVSNAQGSQCIQKLQQLIGTDADGVAGQGTARALQTWLSNHGYPIGNSGVDGYIGADSAKGLQICLNDGLIGSLVSGQTQETKPAPAPAQPSSGYNNPLRGIDVSSHDDFNGSVFKSNTEGAYQGSDFLIVKVSQGIGYVNPQCDGAYQRGKRDGKLLGFYHYAGGNDANQEAQYFYDNARGYFKEGIPVIDWESYQNKAWGNRNWVRTFCNKVHELSGVWPMIYVQASSISQVANCADVCPLWVAGYPDLRNNWNFPTFRYNISPWSAYTVWQYSSSNEQTDRNVANVSADGWHRIAQGS